MKRNAEQIAIDIMASMPDSMLLKHGNSIKDLLETQFAELIDKPFNQSINEIRADIDVILELCHDIEKMQNSYENGDEFEQATNDPGLIYEQGERRETLTKDLINRMKIFVAVYENKL